MLPFATEIMICSGREISALLAHKCFARYPPRPDIVRFVSVLQRPPRTAPTLPLTLPPRGQWLVKILAREGRFVLGMYRRHMKTIAYLGKLDRVFGMSTTRNWNTITAIAKVVGDGE